MSIVKIADKCENCIYSWFL